MGFKTLSAELNFISRLPDEPNDSLGMSAGELKAEFDKAGLSIKDYINNSLLPELEAPGAAAKLGLENIQGLSSAGTVQEAVRQLVERIKDVSMGGVPEGSVGSSKLAPGAVTEDKLANGAVSGDKLAPGAVDGRALKFSAVGSGNIAPGAVEAEALARGSVSSEKIREKAVNTLNINDFAVTNEKLAGYSVTDGKILKGAVSRLYTLSLPAAGWQREGNLFTQSIGEPLISDDSSLIADLDTSAAGDAELEALCGAWAGILRIECSGGMVKFTAAEALISDIDIKLLEVKK